MDVEKKWAKPSGQVFTPTQPHPPVTDNAHVETTYFKKGLPCLVKIIPQLSFALAISPLNNQQRQLGFGEHFYI